MDFVSARLIDGRWFRTLTVLDLYTRESLALVADRSLTGVKVAATLSRVLQHRAAPTAITVDNGGEFVSRAMDAWAYAHDVRLDFIRPGKPVENAFMESFNGKLRDECLNSHVFVSVAEAQHVLDAWRDDYNLVRPHSSLQDRTPAAVGALWVDSREPRESTAMNGTGIELEIADRLFRRRSFAGRVTCEGPLTIRVADRVGRSVEASSAGAWSCGVGSYCGRGGPTRTPVTRPYSPLCERATKIFRRSSWNGWRGAGGSHRRASAMRTAGPKGADHLGASGPDPEGVKRTGANRVSFLQ
jgi:hypothetical protein